MIINGPWEKWVNSGGQYWKKNPESKWQRRKFTLLGIHMRTKRDKREGQHLGRIRLDSVDFDKLVKLWKTNGTECSYYSIGTSIA